MTREQLETYRQAECEYIRILRNYAYWKAKVTALRAIDPTPRVGTGGDVRTTMTDLQCWLAQIENARNYATQRTGEDAWLITAQRWVIGTPRSKRDKKSRWEPMPWADIEREANITPSTRKDRIVKWIGWFMADLWTRGIQEDFGLQRQHDREQSQVA